MNKKLIIAVSCALLALPVAALAVPVYSSGSLPNTLPNATLDGVVLAILGIIWPIFMGFAVIMFFIAGFNLLNSQGDDSKVKDARNAIIWGVAGLAVGLLALTIPVVVRTAFGL